jgi:hypothetical protein
VTDIIPKLAGVYAGYEADHWEIPRPNPYPLRSPERAAWHEGYPLGRRLREKHKAELAKLANDTVGGA